MNKKPHLCTVRQIAATGVITEYALRLMLKQGKVPSVIYVGRKALINYDAFLAMLNQGGEIHVDHVDT